MSLPRDYNFLVFNETGVSIPVSELAVTARKFRFSTSGSIIYEAAEATVYTNNTSIANAAYDVGTPDNQSNNNSLWIGGDFLFQATLTVSGDGNLSLYLARSTDGGTVFDTNSEAMLVSVISVISSETRRTGFGL